MPKLRSKAIFVAIPSTSGTASEVTAFSVITDYSSGIKYPLADFEITPDIAVLDTDIPLTMPPKLTAHTGMDALTHALEAYVATARSDFSDALALKAIGDIFDSFLTATTATKKHAAKCTLPSASQAWRSATRFWALPTAWRTKPAQYSTFRTAAATQFFCRPLSSTTPAYA